MIDLHIHSNRSDGTFSPQEIISKVCEAGLYGFSLTDHDTTEGIPEILSGKLPENIHFLPGIEISCDTPKHEIHILGYGIDHKNTNLNQTLLSLREGRLQRNLDMISLFQKRWFSDHTRKTSAWKSQYSHYPCTFFASAGRRRYLQDKRTGI